MKSSRFALIALLFSMLMSTGCFKLDNNLYDNSEKISEYKRDNYKGQQDFILDDSYKIPDSLIHEFKIYSSANKPNQGGYEIVATYIGDIARIKTDTVIMYCHGNKWHMDFYWQRAKLLANTGWKNRFGVLMIDYRGYGLSAGKPSEEGLYVDVDCSLVWLRAQGLTNDRLVMYGFSMGTAPATMLAANPRNTFPSLIPAWLILEAPFASAETMVQDGSKLAMPGSFMTSLKIDNAEEIKKVQQPLLWMHGTNDSFLSIKTHGEVVFKNYSGKRGVPVRVQGAEHSTIQTTMGFAAYTKTVLDFITSK